MKKTLGLLLILALQVFSTDGTIRFNLRKNNTVIISNNSQKRRQEISKILKVPDKNRNCTVNSFGCTSNNDCCSGFCDKEIRICKPPCGKSDFNSSQPTASQARKANYGEFPWHAGIYELTTNNGSYQQICGGTLISRNVVITTAYCVTIENDEKPEQKDLETLKVAVGKYYKNLNAAEDKLAQIREVEKIEIGFYYRGKIAKYTDDIAFITLRGNAIFSRAVAPVCVDLNDAAFEEDQLTRGSMGKIVGWNENTETLNSIDLQYVPKDECKSNITAELRPYIMWDKICARGVKSASTTVCPEDSGGGLVFKDTVTNAYYLRGILTLGEARCKEVQYTIFTKLTYHVQLAEKYLQDCDRISYMRVCGRSVSQQIVTRSRPAELNEFPWHVGIYQYNASTIAYDQICGGTLISHKVVISAAHCFARLRKDLGKISITDPSTIKIAAGKYYRLLNESEDNTAQILDVNSIEISPQYLGPMDFYSNDIAFVTLIKPVTYNTAVRPVCLDLGEDNFEEDQLKKVAVGKSVGWSIKSNYEKLNDTLRVAEMPYVQRQECRNQIRYMYESYVTDDKMCAGYKSSLLAVCSSDGGGGLFFEDSETKGYYLRGIVSLGPENCYEQGFVLFTKLSAHKNFVQKYIKECRGVCKRQKCKPLTSKKLFISCFTPDGQSTRCDKPMPTNSKAIFSCNPPSYYKIKEPEYNTTQCKNGRWDRPLVDNFCNAECGRSVPKMAHQPVVSYGRRIEYGEFPWQTGIYEYKKNSNYYDQICGGTLISHRIVISAAHCVTVDKLRNVKIKEYQNLKITVGKFFRSLKVFEEEAFAQIVDVENIEIPWRYVGQMSLYDYDISFLTLKTEIEYSPAIAPVCLDIGENNFEEEHLKKGSIGKVVGWGLTMSGAASETLVMAEMPFVPKNECVNKIRNTLILPANRDNMICAGNKSSSMSVCKGDSGGGLVFEDRETKKHYLRGIVSLGPQGCKGEEYALFTKLSFYKDLVKKYLRLP